MSRYQDTRSQYARLADGETVLAPGQTEPITVLVARGRMVPVRVNAPKAGA